MKLGLIRALCRWGSRQDLYAEPPRILKEDALWAYELVFRSIKNMIAKFDKTNGSNKIEICAKMILNKLRECARASLNGDIEEFYAKNKTFQAGEKMPEWRKKGVLSKRDIARLTGAYASERSKAIADLMEAGHIEQINYKSGKGRQGVGYIAIKITEEEVLSDEEQ